MWLLRIRYGNNVLSSKIFPTLLWVHFVYSTFENGWMTFLVSENPWSKSESDSRLWIKNTSSVPDPGSGAFLTPDPGSGICLFPDPGSRIPNLYFWELNDNFWVKSYIILCELAQMFFFATSTKIFQFCDICGYKRGTTNFAHPSLLLLFLDPGWTKIKIRDKYPGPQQWIRGSCSCSVNTSCPLTSSFASSASACASSSSSTWPAYSPLQCKYHIHFNTTSSSRLIIKPPSRGWAVTHLQTGARVVNIRRPDRTGSAVR